MTNVVFRPNAVGLALAKAALKVAPTIKVADQSNWVARRVLLACEQEHVGMHPEPATNAHLRFATAKKLKAQGVL